MWRNKRIKIENNWNLLPVELEDFIFSLLDIHDFPNAMLVNKHWFSIITDEQHPIWAKKYFEEILKKYPSLKKEITFTLHESTHLQERAKSFYSSFIQNSSSNHKKKVLEELRHKPLHGYIFSLVFFVIILALYLFFKYRGVESASITLSLMGFPAMGILSSIGCTMSHAIKANNSYHMHQQEKMKNFFIAAIHNTEHQSNPISSLLITQGLFGATQEIIDNDLKLNADETSAQNRNSHG
jgi:hypothetical protein